jgi:dTDP-4-dehydrorhamnose 3,5-epimerase
LDVAVDIRRGSPTFGKYVAVELSGKNHLQLFVPRGFAHGFSVLSETAVVQYKCDNYYSPAHERSIIFNDPQLGIDWKIDAPEAVISDKDRLGKRVEEADLFDNEIDYYL